MTVDNRGGLATFSPDLNRNKIALREDFLIPGSCVDLGCGAGVYREVIARRCPGLLQVDLVDRRLPGARQFPLCAMDATTVGSIRKSFVNLVALDILAHTAHE